MALRSAHTLLHRCIGRGPAILISRAVVSHPTRITCATRSSNGSRSPTRGTIESARPARVLCFLRSAADWSHYSNCQFGGSAMRTTILAYVLAFMGLVTIAVGVRDLFAKETARARLRYYAMAIGIISGGLAMGGLALATRD